MKLFMHKYESPFIALKEVLTNDFNLKKNYNIYLNWLEIYSIKYLTYNKYNSFLFNNNYIEIPCKKNIRKIIKIIKDARWTIKNFRTINLKNYGININNI